MGRSSEKSQPSKVSQASSSSPLLVPLPSAAPGWPSDGSAVPVPGLANVQGHSGVQALLLEAHPPGGQVARGIQWGRRPHSRALLVSIPGALTSGGMSHSSCSSPSPSVHTEETSSPTEFDLVCHFKSKSLVLVPGTLSSSFLCLPGHEVSILPLSHACLTGVLSPHGPKATGPASHEDRTPQLWAVTSI